MNPPPLNHCGPIRVLREPPETHTKVEWALDKTRVANKLKGPCNRLPRSLDKSGGHTWARQATPRATPPRATPPDPGALAFPPYRGTRQDKDGFLSRERYVRVRLHQSLHSGQRQPGEPSPGCSRRGLGLRSRGLPSGSLLLSGRPAPRRRRRRHPHPERAARDRRLSAHTRRRPLFPRRSETTPLGVGVARSSRGGARRKRPLRV